MNKRKEVVRNRLKKYRRQFGYTQKEVATILGFTSEERISHWEKGNNVPNLINLLKLISLYRATPMQLYPELMQDADEEVEDQITRILSNLSPPIGTSTRE